LKKPSTAKDSRFLFKSIVPEIKPVPPQVSWHPGISFFLEINEKRRHTFFLLLSIFQVPTRGVLWILKN
jgi:hypothetical protein